MNIAVNDGLLQVFDVEHGACALFTVPDGPRFRRLMIDCGDNTTTGFKPGPHLAKYANSYLDQLVITNLDEDHASGFPSLAESKVYVRWMLFNPSVSGPIIKTLKSETKMGKGIEALVAADASYVPVPTTLLGGNPAAALPGVEMEWFWNQYPHFEDENNLSLILLVKFRGVWFLFPGDMEEAGFKNLIDTNARFRTILPLVDVLMASHHGRMNGLYRPMFEEHGCLPWVTVISDDYKQYDTQETTTYYGNHTKGIFDYRAGYGVRKVLTTRSDGEVLFSFRNGGCFVHWLK